MARPSGNHAGFTLIEMLVTLGVIGLSMSLIFGYGEALLPQTRLAASAKRVGGRLQEMRNHAVSTQKELVFTYHLDDDTFTAHYPVELDDEGRLLGPGETSLLDPEGLEAGIVIEKIFMPDGTVREEGDVPFGVSRRGRITPHWVLVVNPDYAEIERYYVQVSGLTNTYELLDELAEKVVMDDSSFR